MSEPQDPGSEPQVPGSEPQGTGDVQPVTGTVLTPEQLAALAAIAGNINVDITLPSGTKYALGVSIPTAATDPYTFLLTETQGTGNPQTLVDFNFVNSTNFEVEVNFPQISAGGVTINGGFDLKATP